jgi:hypothetical protein
MDLFPRSPLRTADSDSDYNSTTSIVSSLWLDASLRLFHALDPGRRNDGGRPH